MERRHLRTIGCTAATTACSIAVLACLLGGFAVQRGRIEPPNLDVRVGRYHLVGFTALATACPKQARLLPARRARYVRGIYTILLFTPIEGRESSGFGRALLKLPLRC